MKTLLRVLAFGLLTVVLVFGRTVRRVNAVLHVWPIPGTEWFLVIEFGRFPAGVWRIGLDLSANADGVAGLVQVFGLYLGRWYVEVFFTTDDWYTAEVVP